MARIIILLFVCWTIGCSTKGQDSNKKKIEELTKLAEVNDSLKDQGQSILYYTEILEIDSTNLQALVNRGRALIWIGKLSEGFSDYNKAVQLYPHERTFYARGMAYVNLKEYEKGFQDITRSLELNPGFGEAYFGLSFIKEAQGNLDSALLYCDKAEIHGSPLQQLQERKAGLYEKQGNYPAAINVMTKLIQAVPSNATYYNNRGYEKNQLQQYAEAIKDLDMAIKLDSSMAFAYSNKAFALLKQNQTNRALANANISLHLDSQNPYAFKTRGEIYLSLHQKDKACSDFTHAETLNKGENLRKELKALRDKSCKS
jgi:tetratricopeptide (TPR) repeat protein